MIEILSFFGGSILGLAFFGNLFWMTKRIANFKNPVATMLISFFLRLGGATGCFLLMVLKTSLLDVAIFFIGFLSAKIFFLLKKVEKKT